MNATTNTLYISGVSIFLSLVTTTINVFCLCRVCCKKHSSHITQFSMLIVKMVFDTCFALTTVVYSTSVILQLCDVTDNPYILYPAGTVIQSQEAAMAVLNVFIAVDRLYAMRKPFKYNRLYSGLILKISVALILLIFAASFAIYTITRPDNGHIHGYTFTHFVNRFYQSVIHLCTVGAFLFSMVVTILFLHDFYGFLKRSNNGQMGSYTKSVNAANKIVVYLMAVEFICLVVPNTLEIILRYFFDIRMGNFGPVIHPLFVLYITISSLLFLMSSTKNMKSSPPSPVQTVPVTMHNWTSGVAGTHSGHLMHHSQK